MIRSWIDGLAILMLMGTVLTQGVFAEGSEEQPPNIILIVCDDLGYADIEPFGSKLHRTPHLNEMASRGTCFTSFYVTSGVCSPSRSSIMTGCYPKRVGLHQNEKGQWVLFPGNARGLNPDEVTIAEVLKQRDYATACVGKWHLGDQPVYLPTRQGFDSYFGIPFSNDMGETDRPKKPYPPLPLLRNEVVIEEEPDQRYLTKRYTEEAMKFIKAHRDEPFFLYMPHTMPHWPQYASEAFAGKSKNGKWGDTVEEIDWSLGKLRTLLDELDLIENTCVIFISDNGGATRHGAHNEPLRGGKGSTWEGGQRVPCIISWPGVIPSGARSDVVLSSLDFLPTLAGFAKAQVDKERRIDGMNAASQWKGESTDSPHEVFSYFHLGTLEAVRSGPWKLFVAKHRKQDFEPKLFHVLDDIGEEKDVASEHPEVVSRLTAMAEAVIADLGTATEDGPGTRPPGHVSEPVPLTRAR